jgi:protoheme IX farnesyltransferase
MIIRSAAVRSVLSFEKDKICSRHLAAVLRPRFSETLHRSSIHTKRKLHGSLVPDKDVQRNMVVAPQSFMHDYFSANTSIDRGWVKNGVMAAWRTFADTSSKSQTEDSVASELLARQKLSSGSPEAIEVLEQDSQIVAQPPAQQTFPIERATASPDVPDLLPHRRRLARKKEQQGYDETIPLDASSQLSTAASNMPLNASFRRSFATYLSLAKPRLSFLIVLTSATAYSLYPVPDILSSTTSLENTTLSSSTLTLLFLTAGTFLSCASANTLNMLYEPSTDAKMSRTRNRPLVRKLVSPRAAGAFALLCGAAGLILLDLGTNSTVAALSALNIFLYAGVYTPMKRISVLNTWVGAVVGAIPPLMGWVAAAGQAATAEHHSWQDLLFSESSIGGWCLAGLLFAWQFPHFNALSHAVRFEYRDAGLRMLAWTNPAMNARVALRYSLAMFPLCFGLWGTGVVNGGFLAISTVFNLWMTKEAVGLWRNPGSSGSARRLFWASIWHLPLVMVGALVCKKGIWDGLLGEDETSEGEVLVAKVRPEDVARHNMAMMGFKRPS